MYGKMKIGFGRYVGIGGAPNIHERGNDSGGGMTMYPKTPLHLSNFNHCLVIMNLEEDTNPTFILCGG